MTDDTVTARYKVLAWPIASVTISVLIVLAFAIYAARFTPQVITRIPVPQQVTQQNCAALLKRANLNPVKPNAPALGKFYVGWVLTFSGGPNKQLSKDALLEAGIAVSKCI